MAGCCAHMVGFAVASWRENRFQGLAAQGLGTSMLQVPNLMRKPVLWLPAVAASLVGGPLATCVFHLEQNGFAIASGMGTCGLVGPIGVIVGWVNGDGATGLGYCWPLFGGREWFPIVVPAWLLICILGRIRASMRRRGPIRQTSRGIPAGSVKSEAVLPLAASAVWVFTDKALAPPYTCRIKIRAAAP